MRGLLPGLWKIIGARQGRDLRLFALCPIRVQQSPPRARFRWSAPGAATPSGAVSAGSNPAGALVEALKSNRTSETRGLPAQLADLQFRNGAVLATPHTPPNGHSFGLRYRSPHTEGSAYQAVAPSKKMTGARPGNGQLQAATGRPERSGPADGQNRPQERRYGRDGRASTVRASHPAGRPATALRAARPACHLPRSVSTVVSPLPPTCGRSLTGSW